jgi:hypothetical protein
MSTFSPEWKRGVMVGEGGGGADEEEEEEEEECSDVDDDVGRVVLESGTVVFSLSVAEDISLFSSSVDFNFLIPFLAGASII